MRSLLLMCLAMMAGTMCLGSNVKLMARERARKGKKEEKRVEGVEALAGIREVFFI